MMPFLRCLAQEDRKGHSKFYPLELLELVFEPTPPPAAPVNILRKNQNELEFKKKEPEEEPIGSINDEQVKTSRNELKINRRKRWATVNSYESPSDSDAEDAQSFDDDYVTPVMSSEREIYIEEAGEKYILQVIRPELKEEAVNQLSIDMKKGIEIHE
jgi:hypothetical protein